MTYYGSCLDLSDPVRIGCFKGRISRLENGHIIPNLYTIQNFAKACGRDFIMILATGNDKKIINRLNQ